MIDRDPHGTGHGMDPARKTNAFSAFSSEFFRFHAGSRNQGVFVRLVWMRL